MKSRFHSTIAGTLAWLAFPTAGLFAAPIGVIYSTIANHPTSLVPGLGGVRFDVFNEPWRSPDGTHWMMLASTIRGAIEDDVLLRGFGMTGSVVLKEGDPAPWLAGETINTLDFVMGLNDFGQWAISANTSGGPDVGDEYMLRWNGSSYDIIAQEGQPVPSVPGATYGVILDEAHILNDGTVGFRCINVNNVPTNQNVMLFLGNALIAREGVTIPSGQVLGGQNPLENFDFLTYQHSADGSKYMVSGDTLAASNFDGVFVVNNTVLIQEGVQFRGFSVAVVSGLSGFVETNMAANGDWYARGSNTGGQDWVVRNSILLAKTGDQIFPGVGGGETWSDATPNVRTYDIHLGNNHGDFAIGGWTSNANLNLNHVIVLNNQRVAVREGDMVDLNNNGLNDDDCFIASFDDDEAFINDQPVIYFVAKLRNGAGTAIGEAFCRRPLCIAGTNGDFNGDCTVNVDDLLGVINAWGRCPALPAPCPADFDHNGFVNVDDLLNVINHWG